MIKTVSIVLLSSSLLVASSNNIPLNNDDFNNEEMKHFLQDIKNKLPDVSDTIKDYFEVKTCKEDFYNVITIDDIKAFTATSSFAVMTSLKVLENQNKYNEILNIYNLMNCNKGDKINLINTNINTKE